MNYFIGNEPARWHTDIPTYAKVVYSGVYPGVDLEYHGVSGRIEYDFVIAPGGDPTSIAIRFAGSDGLAIDDDGDLVLRVAGGELRERKPVIYQSIWGIQRRIDGGFRLSQTGEVGFTVAGYDRSRPLVIDPVIVYSTYLGGSGVDGGGRAIAVDAANSAYIVGTTASTNIPTTLGAYQPAFGGGPYDAFVAKLNPTGSALVYATYLGGAGDDEPQAIAIDGLGSAYVVGITSGGFPITPGAFDASYGGDLSDGFVAKLNPAGNALIYSSYLGGNGRDYANAVVVDSSGSAYVGGSTSSTNFPTTPGAFQTTNTDNIPCPGGPCYSAFVTKVNPTGTGLAYSTYLGGTQTDGGQGIAVDSGLNAYLTGNSGCAPAPCATTNFPTTPGSFQPVFPGTVQAAFVAKLNATGSALIYATYLGGNGNEEGASIVVDALANAFITGSTTSTNFPVTVGSLQMASAGGRDAFITKLNPAGNGLVYSTYLGGAATDAGRSITIDAAGNAYVAGATSSGNFPTTAGSPQVTFAGGPEDAFVAKLNPSGTALAYSTFLGGAGDDAASGIGVDSSTNAYVVGTTSSTNFPTTSGAFQTAYGGGSSDAFVAKIGATIGPPATLTLTPATATNTVGATHCVTATVKDASGNPTPSLMVVFSVVGAQANFATPSNGSSSTNGAGQATFCFTASLPGENGIHAFADSNNNGTQEPGEPFGDATKTWVPPTSTQLCEVTITDGGWIITDDTDKATFGGNAKVQADDSVQGHEQYTDHGPVQPLAVSSIQITATTCNDARTMATIFGTATIDGAGTHAFRIDVTDNVPDTYGILLDTGYASGQHPLGGGQITIH